MFHILRLLFISACLSYIKCAENTTDESTRQWILDLFKDVAETSSTIGPSTSNGVTFVCTTDDGEQGFCVKKSLCNIPPTPVDPTKDFTQQVKECHYLQECCPRNAMISETENIFTHNKLQHDICGVSSPGILFKNGVRNDMYSDFGEFPWMVALLRRNNGEWSSNYIGGGTLIHRSVVMTAAHKVSEIPTDQIKCRAGEYDTLTENEIAPYQERNVKSVKVHPKYLRARLHYDVALLFLTAPFSLEEVPHIGIACLAGSLPKDGTACFTMGWGKEPQDAEKYAHVLKKAQLPFVESSRCESYLKQTRLSSKYTLHESLICAEGEEGADTCLVDGGSPLVCPIKNSKNVYLERYAVYGMVAYGVYKGCGRKDVPDVFVNVPLVRQWIDDEIENETFLRQILNIKF